MIDLTKKPNLCVQNEEHKQEFKNTQLLRQRQIADEWLSSTNWGFTNHWTTTVQRQIELKKNSNPHGVAGAVYVDPRVMERPPVYLLMGYHTIHGAMSEMDSGCPLVLAIPDESGFIWI